jgi:hypothetical protein
MRRHVKEFLLGMMDGYVEAHRRLWPLLVVCLIFIAMMAVGPEACSRCQRPEAARKV